MKVNWSALRDLIQANRRFVLTTHVRPDADALGSEQAMAGLLRQLGKEVRIINASAVPKRLAFLDPQGVCLQLGQGATLQQALDTDVHMILDTSAWGQLGEMGRVIKETTAIKIVVDHHVSSEDLGATEFRDTSAEATGAMIFHFAEATGIPITPEIADAMFCAIATDTGWFRFSSTTSGTMRTIASLIDYGVSPSAMYGRLYEQYTLGRIKLAGHAMLRMALECDGKLAWTYVRQQDYTDTGAEPADTEDLVNECLTVAGVEAACILIEQNNGNVKCSLRSRSHLDVSRVAEKFGGGGHKQAAGVILPGPLPDAQAKILAAVRAIL
jgi:bifunctional oligoribonuclease and PAP phosphatase NrnA